MSKAEAVVDLHAVAVHSQFTKTLWTGPAVDIDIDPSNTQMVQLFPTSSGGASPGLYTANPIIEFNTPASSNLWSDLSTSRIDITFRVAIPVGNNPAVANAFDAIRFHEAGAAALFQTIRMFVNDQPVGYVNNYGITSFITECLNAHDEESIASSGFYLCSSGSIAPRAVGALPPAQTVAGAAIRYQILGSSSHQVLPDPMTIIDGGDPEVDSINKRMASLVCKSKYGVQVACTPPAAAANSAYINLSFKPILPLFTTGKLLPVGSRVRLVLERANPAVSFIQNTAEGNANGLGAGAPNTSSAQLNVDANITNISWSYRQIRFNQGVQRELTDRWDKEAVEGLPQGPLPFYADRVQSIIGSRIVAGSTSADSIALYMGTRPTLAVVAFVASDSLTNNYTYDICSLRTYPVLTGNAAQDLPYPVYMSTDMFNISSLYLTVGGQQIPQIAFRDPRPTQNGDARVYQAYRQACKASYTKKALLGSPLALLQSSFDDCYPLWCFELDPSGAIGAADAPVPSEPTQIDLHVQFVQGVAIPITPILYLITQESIICDSMGQWSSSF